MRGYQKKVIFLKNTGSHLFDEAYFVVSRQGEEAAVGQSNMVLEANRIIRESMGEETLGRGRGRRILDFLLPFLLGVLFTVTAVMIINLFTLLF